MIMLESWNLGLWACVGMTLLGANLVKLCQVLMCLG